MFAKVKSSLVVQNNFLFLFSIFIIANIWFGFYLLQKHQDEEHTLIRYLNAFNYLHPLLKTNKEISKDTLNSFQLSFYDGAILKNYKVTFKRGSSEQGVESIKFGNQRILHLYSLDDELFLKDLHLDYHMNFIHGLFIFLVIAQITLHFKVNSFLRPLSLISKKLKNLKKDRSSLNIDSKYDEIKLIVNSYNNSIKKIDYMLETREMFNKIFMHEMKMPLAKGMFYLKQDPSLNTHKKLYKILHGINEELEEFSHIETLIAYQNNIDTTAHYFLDILNIAKNRAGLSDKSIEIETKFDNIKLRGDKDFWVLCIKNILDNGVKYSNDKKIILGYDNGIYFKNKGEELPVDISNETNKWKIDKNRRHKSSTGYGFGLFIIKNIVIFNNYTLEYKYNKEKNK